MRIFHKWDAWIALLILSVVLFAWWSTSPYSTIWGDEPLTWTPKHFQKWRANNGTNKCMIGGNIENYPDTDSTWAEIQNDWTQYGNDSIVVRECFMQTKVTPDGTTEISVTWDGQTYVLTQTLKRLAWLQISTGNYQTIFDNPSISAQNGSVDSNIVRWTNVWPHIDYGLKKRKGQIEHALFFDAVALDSLQARYLEWGEDTLDVALANLMQYTLSSNCDDYNTSPGDLDNRKFKTFANKAFAMANSWLHFPGSDTLSPNITRVNHRWIKQTDKYYCVEWVPFRNMSIAHEMYPNATIWHNDSPTTIQDLDDIEDTWIWQSNANTNYEGYTYMGVHNDKAALIRVLNVDTYLGGGVTAVTACTLGIYNWLNSSDGEGYAHRLFKPWDATTVTWNDWDGPDLEWTIGGANEMDDAGSDNSGDGTGADATETQEDDVDIVDPSTWYYLEISTALAYGWYAGTHNENGVKIYDDDGSSPTGLNYLYAQEQDIAVCPKFIFYYTTGGAAGQVIIINTIVNMFNCLPWGIR